MRIPSINPEPNTTRDALISALSKRWPLTAKELCAEVKRNYGVTVTYQAVHKLLQQLVSDGILILQDGTYRIDLNWIRNLRKFTEDIEQAYARDTTPPKFEMGIGSSVERDPFSAGKEAAQKALTDIRFHKVQLALVFASSAYAQDFPSLLRGIRSMAKNVPLAGCSPLGGEIADRALGKSVVVALLAADPENFQATPI